MGVEWGVMEVEIHLQGLTKSRQKKRVERKVERRERESNQVPPGSQIRKRMKVSIVFSKGLCVRIAQ